MVGQSTRQKTYIALSAPGHKHLPQPVLLHVVQFLFEASDLATEVTLKASRTSENEAEGAQRRPSTKIALFSDQYSELDDEITSLISPYGFGHPPKHYPRRTWLHVFPLPD